MLVLRTLGAPQRRRLKGRRGRDVEEAEPEPVPTSRATVVRPEPFPSDDAAAAWLEEVRAEPEGEIAGAVRELNGALHAHRVAVADPYARDVSAEHALAVRLGYGSGDEVAAGRFAAAWEPPGRRERTKRSMEAPEERFAALLGGHETALPAEELVLRARADLDAGRGPEAALEARVALESLLVSLEGDPGRADLEDDRRAVGDAANAALRGELAPATERDLAEAVARMEAALRRRRLRGS